MLGHETSHVRTRHLNWIVQHSSCYRRGYADRISEERRVGSSTAVFPRRYTLVREDRTVCGDRRAGRLCRQLVDQRWTAITDPPRGQTAVGSSPPAPLLNLPACSLALNPPPVGITCIRGYRTGDSNLVSMGSVGRPTARGLVYTAGRIGPAPRPDAALALGEG